MPNTVRIGTQVTGVRKSSSDLDNLRDKFAKLQSQGAKGFAIGAGAAITAGALGLVADAADRAVDAVAGMVRGAMEDETSIAKLTTVLEANVKGWDGNTAAIEDTIAARMKLGFADDVQRESLALLVVKTGDVTEALRIQRVAMDLARLKGISLADASRAIVMGMMGQGRALKELGINVKEMTDKTEVLGVVQQKAGGQAEKFADTTTGALESMQVAIDEAGESIGEDLLPMIKDLAFFVRDDLVPAVGDAKEAMDHLGWAMQFQRDNAEDLWIWQKGLLGLWTDSQQGAEAYAATLLAAAEAEKTAAEAKRWAAAAVEWAAEKAAKTAAEWADRRETDWARERMGAAETSQSVVAAFTDTAAAAKTSARVISTSLGDIADDFDATWSELSGAADQAAEDIFGPLERRAELAANKLAQGAALGVMADPKSSKTDITAARAELLGLQKDFFTLTAEMAGRGELTAAELKKLNAALKAQLKTAANEEAVSILALIALLDRLEAKAHGVFPVAPRAGSGLPGGGGRAAGGPASGPTLVGERGPELLNLPTGTMVNPSAAAGLAAIPRGGGSGGGSDALLAEARLTNALLSRLTAQEPYAARPQTARGDLARQAAMMPGGRL